MLNNIKYGMNMFFVIIIICLAPANHIYSQGIDKYFIKINSIVLPEEIIVGGINSIDVNASGDIIILDEIGQQVLLYKRKTNTFKKLDTSKKNPGLKWYPLGCFFNKKNEIYVIANNMGLIFDNEGEFLRKMDDEFISSKKLCFLKNGDIIGCYSKYNKGPLKRMNPFGKRKNSFGYSPENYESINYRIEGGGLVCDNNDFIYHNFVSGPEIYVYNSNDSLINIIDRFSKRYDKIRTKVLKRISDPKSFVMDLIPAIKSSAISQNLFLLRDDLLLLQMFDRGDKVIELIRTNGNLYSKEPIKVDDFFVFAKDGYAYRSYQPEPDKKGNLPNPIIEVYKLK